MILCGQKYQNYKFHGFKIYCVSFHTDEGSCPLLSMISTEVRIVFLRLHTHVPSVSCGRGWNW